MSKRFEDYVAEGKNNTLECLKTLIDGDPKRFKPDGKENWVDKELKESKASALPPRLVKANLFVKTLEEANKKTVIITDPRRRIRDAVNRFNDNVGKLEIEELAIPENLANHQLDRLRESKEIKTKLEMPNFGENSEAVAHIKPVKRLELEIKL